MCLAPAAPHDFSRERERERQRERTFWLFRRAVCGRNVLTSKSACGERERREMEDRERGRRTCARGAMVDGAGRARAHLIEFGFFIHCRAWVEVFFWSSGGSDSHLCE